MLFTAPKQDSCNARYYDPATGRFIQPDSIVPQPYNPSAWNSKKFIPPVPLPIGKRGGKGRS
jgi:hypothetical protein